MSFSSAGSGNQCCYDDADQLVHSADDPSGSRPQRSHVWGSPPYQNPPRVPALSHWQSDVTGYYYCCEWAANPARCHETLVALRGTRDCQGYTPSGQAVAYGDPHFVTLEGVQYTFNGYGEFWLMEVKDAQVHGETVNFKLHARLEQPNNQSWGEVHGTFMTAVGLQMNEGRRVVLELNRDGHQKALLVHIDDYLLDLTKYDLRRQELDDFIIINNDPAEESQGTNFTVVYRCGLGVHVTWQTHLLNLVVSAPPEFKYNTRGLLGKWNDDPADDLEPREPGGPSFQPGETDKVHYVFGVTWAVSHSESCFQHLYNGQLNHGFYNRPGYLPNFSAVFPPNQGGITDEMVNSLCGGNFECTYDYKTTLLAGIAQDTLDAQQWHQQRRVMGQTVLTCGLLDVPFSTKQHPISYTEGSTVTITGCVGEYSLEGPTVYTCQTIDSSRAEWSPDITTVCHAPGEAISESTILFIAIPVALGGVLIIIAIVVLVLTLRKRKKKKRQKEAGKQAYVPVNQGTSSSDPPYRSTSGDKPTNQRLADVMGTSQAADRSVFPPTQAKPTTKPPRPIPKPRDTTPTDSLDVTKEVNQSDDSGQSSGNKNVSWDTQDGFANTQPLQQSTLQSNKPEISYDTSGLTNSPNVKKKKRPYGYPTETPTDDSWDSANVTFRSQGVTVPTATYRPKDPHAYTGGHNIPTAEGQSSSYYQRKYGKAYGKH